MLVQSRHLTLLIYSFSIVHHSKVLECTPPTYDLRTLFSPSSNIWTDGYPTERVVNYCTRTDKSTLSFFTGNILSFVHVESSSSSSSSSSSFSASSSSSSSFSSSSSSSSSSFSSSVASFCLFSSASPWFSTSS